jgi:hypothetical protein
MENQLKVLRAKFESQDSSTDAAKAAKSKTLEAICKTRDAVMREYDELEKVAAEYKKVKA